MIKHWLILTPLLLSCRLPAVTADCGRSYYSCWSGECIKWRHYCDGRCNCLSDCSDEDPQRCQVLGGDNANSLKDQQSTSSGAMSSGAMVGIIVACLAVLFLLIVGIVLFLICRGHLLAAKTPQSRRRQAVDDVRALQQSGCGLPVDIPIEALTREPPPRYTSLDLSTCSQQDLSISTLPPPPPYTVQTSAMGTASVVDESLVVPPFNLDASRRSVSGIIIHASSPRVAPRAGSASAGRLRSVDSFTEYPNMSDILLTSSRSSLPTSSDSAAAAVEDAMVAVSPATRRSDSARGDSLDSWPSVEQAGSGGSDPPQRSCSLSDVAVAHGGSGRQQVPDSELQRQARRRTAGASPPRARTTSLDHGISMDPGASTPAEGDASRQRRRRPEAGGGCSTSERRHQRRQHQADQRADKRHKSRSLNQMTTVDEELTTTASASASRLDAPAFTGSAV